MLQGVMFRGRRNGKAHRPGSISQPREHYALVTWNRVFEIGSNGKRQYFCSGLASAIESIRVSQYAICTY